MKLRPFISLLVLCTLIAAHQPPQPETLKEYKVKAVFLFNFTRFVEWPTTSFATTDAPFVIGIVGKDPFGAYLDESVQEENVQGHPFAVRRFRSVDQVKQCHLLFINTSNKEDVSRVLEKLKDQPVLTVGDQQDFSRQGGMIGFITENGKIRLRINREAAKHADLTISSKLLKLAEIVETQSD